MKRTWFAASAVGILIAAEVGVRLAGAVDFPLYDADSEIGYIPKANQSGSFLRRNDWQFNEYHMGTGPLSKEHGAVLLVGDSVVLGGNSYRETDRLGPQLQHALGRPVWPISAGSWALRNELAYLRKNPKVVASAEQIVFVLNDADFDQASSWACEYTHPRTAPWIATYYLARKALYPACGPTPPKLQVPRGDWRPELKAFLATPEARGKRVTAFLHPRREQVEDPAKGTLIAAFSEQLRTAGLQTVLYTGADKRWTSDLYKDGIHPTAAGNAVLASVISDALASKTPSLLAQADR